MTTPREQLAVDRLVDAIRSATGEPRGQAQAAWLAARIRAESGVQRAVDIIRRHYPPSG